MTIGETIMKPHSSASHLRSRWALTAAFAFVLLGACTQNPPADKGVAIEERTPSGDTSGAATGGATGTPIGGSSTGANPLRDPRSPLSKRSVFFDFDRYDVKDEYKPLIEAHGKYLQTNKSAKMTIQGNADERGSREYNIALGQRRADTVKRMMQLYGASDSQIETVSFGKEKPRNQGHDEGAWADNRRDDIVYAGE
jgi:peptidoglycan-associated lipoprotein